MTDEDVVERVASLFDCKKFAYTPRRAAWKTTYQLRLVGSCAVAWMTALRPLMGRRRQQQIDDALASYAPCDRTLLDHARATEAVALLAAGVSVSDVATRFGTTVWCIYDLRLGRTHKGIDRSALRG